MLSYLWTFPPVIDEERAMKLRRVFGDSIEEISRTAATNSALFNTADHAGSHEFVSEFLRRNKEILPSLDTRMRALMDDNGDIVVWSAKMSTCRSMLSILELNLSHFGQPGYNAAQVARAMGYLFAVAQNTELTLGANEPVANSA